MYQYQCWSRSRGARRQRASECVRTRHDESACVPELTTGGRPVVGSFGNLRWRRGRDVSLGARGPAGVPGPGPSVPAGRSGATTGALRAVRHTAGSRGARTVVRQTGDARAERSTVPLWLAWPTPGYGCKARALRETRSHLVQVQVSATQLELTAG